MGCGMRKQRVGAREHGRVPAHSVDLSYRNRGELDIDRVVGRGWSQDQVKAFVI